jgi:hypothetical protein
MHAQTALLWRSRLRSWEKLQLGPLAPAPLSVEAERHQQVRPGVPGYAQRGENLVNPGS